ncbi:MAG: hypothetical protein LBO20_00435 [Bifidobacteriaceae bacterium]|jgi:ABC-type multidrug transport system fused ATPase/permease subunit|nr:hypothetical protein [Bifidobacteriaceae bacterium]
MSGPRSAALDPRAEADVIVRLAEAARGRTAIMVAHRLSTVRWVDRVAVIHAGASHEVGSPGELLAAGGLYADLHRLQTAGYQRSRADTAAAPAHDAVRSP